MNSVVCTLWDRGSLVQLLFFLVSCYQATEVVGGKPAQQMRTLPTHLLTFLANKYTKVDEYIAMSMCD